MEYIFQGTNAPYNLSLLDNKYVKVNIHFFY